MLKSVQSCGKKIFGTWPLLEHKLESIIKLYYTFEWTEEKADESSTYKLKVNILDRDRRTTQRHGNLHQRLESLKFYPSLMFLHFHSRGLKPLDWTPSKQEANPPPSPQIAQFKRQLLRPRAIINKIFLSWGNIYSFAFSRTCKNQVPLCYTRDKMSSQMDSFVFHFLQCSEPLIDFENDKMGGKQWKNTTFDFSWWFTSNRHLVKKSINLRHLKGKENTTFYEIINV